MQEEKKPELSPEKAAEEEVLLTSEGKLPTEEEKPADAEKEPYTPRPLGFRIFALILAVIVIIGMILWYYHIFSGK